MEAVLAQSNAAPIHQRAVDPAAVQKLLEEDPLMLGLTVKEFRRILENISPDHPLCTPSPLVGEMAPTSRAEADALVAKLEAAGGDFADPFKTPAYRVLTDKKITWEGTATATPIGEVIKKLLNGYDGLEFERQDPDLKTQSHCAFQASQGNPGIGPATIFVSWGLASTLFGILQRLEEYVEEKGLDADKTFFWICDFSIRQAPGPGKVGVVGPGLI